MPVGTVIQALFNPNPQKFLPLDGADLNAGDWPELVNDPTTGKRRFPGVFTSTARTLLGAPVVASIAASSQKFLHVGVGSTGATGTIMASSDAVTWSGYDVGSGAVSFSSIIFAGTRFVCAASGVNTPFVTADGNPVSSGSFTATGVAASTTLTQGLAYGSTANAGAGRTVLIQNGAGTGQIYTMDDGASTWSLRTHTNSRTKTAVVWTGQNFIATCSDASNYILTSPTGVTWTERTLPIPYFNGVIGPHFMESDGAGTVVIGCGNGVMNYFVVSKDHGATWRKVLGDQAAHQQRTLGSMNYSNPAIYYVNGKFISLSATTGGLESAQISTDGLYWVAEPMAFGRGAQTKITALAYKSGVYCGVTNDVTAAMTLTEDMSKFKIHESRNPAQGNNANISSMGAIRPEFVKARS